MPFRQKTVIYAVLGEMVQGVVSEVLDEETNMEDDGMALFDIIWEEEDDDEVVIVQAPLADDARLRCEEVPACSSIPPSRSQLKRKIDDIEDNEGLPTNEIFQRYIKDRKNVNTSKKTASVRIKT